MGVARITIIYGSLLFLGGLLCACTADLGTLEARPTDAPVVPLGYIVNPDLISVTRPAPDTLDVVALPNTVRNDAGFTEELCMSAWNSPRAAITDLNKATETVGTIRGTFLKKFFPNRDGSFSTKLSLLQNNEQYLILNVYDNGLPERVRIATSDGPTTAVYTDITASKIPVPKSVFSAVLDSLAALTYATWSSDPSDKDSKIQLSADRLTAFETKGASDLIRATVGKASSRWYFEIKINSTGNDNRDGVGLCTKNQSTGGSVGDDAGCGLRGNGAVECNGNEVDSAGPLTAGDTIGVAFNITDNTISYFHQGAWLNGANPSSGLKGYTMGFRSGYPDYFPCATLSEGASYTLNAGQSPFIYSIPSGYNKGVY